MTIFNEFGGLNDALPYLYHGELVEASTSTLKRFLDVNPIFETQFIEMDPLSVGYIVAEVADEQDPRNGTKYSGVPHWVPKEEFESAMEKLTSEQFSDLYLKKFLRRGDAVPVSKEIERLRISFEEFLRCHPQFSSDARRISECKFG